MKRILTYLVGLAICAALAPELILAQEVVWERTFSVSNRNFYNCFTQQTSDGGYILAGSRSPRIPENGYDTDAFLIKTDEKGQEEWNRIFQAEMEDATLSVQQTSDGGYILAGIRYNNVNVPKVWLIKTDSEGQKEWEKFFIGLNVDNPRCGILSLQQTFDGGYILAGFCISDRPGVWKSDGWLIKTDSQGQKEWERTFGGTEDDMFRSVRQTPDGGYVLFGSLKTAGAWSWASWLIKTDSQGQKEWERTFGGEGNDQDDDGFSVRQTSDGGYILVSRKESDNGWDAWLIKTDFQGYKEWDRIFAKPGIALPQSVQQTSDGGYILAGYNEDYGQSQDSMGWVIKTDSTGYKKWDKIFYCSPEDAWGKIEFNITRAYSVQQTSDGDYVVAGMIWLPSQWKNYSVAWLTKLKGETLTAVEEESNIPEMFTLFQNYPNPFNPATEIAFSLPENSSVTLTVFNALGQKVVTLVDENKGAGSYQVRWDGTGFPSGVYFYRLETQGFSKTRKMLLMK